ncbi:MAG: endonuclease domain-containing protein [Sphingopyxis sp.]|nr:endonuclease domain-containing protein [Sphingopyxis sp.]
MRDPRLVEFAKAMRREMTEPEKRLWYELRAKRFDGVKFRRQNVVGNYIADFYSRSARLIIEVDGDSHAFRHEYDRVREQYFNSKGFRVIRFANSDVMTNMESVLTTIGQHLTPPLPTLSPKGERAS